MNLTIFKFEFKRRLRPNLVYALAMTGLLLMFMVLLDTLQQNSKQIEELFKAFGPQLLQAFGTSIEGLTTVTGYFGTRVGFLLVIIGGIFAGSAGVSTISGEQSSSTLSFLTTKAVSRVTIYLQKVAAILVHLIWVNVVLFLVSLLSVELFSQESASEYVSYFIAVYIGVFVLQFFFMSLGILIGSFINSSRAQAVIISTVFVSYILDILSKISTQLENLKYISANYYLDFEYLNLNESLKPAILFLVLVCLIITVINIYRFKSCDIEN